MSGQVSIYALADPRKPDVIRYIGKTIKQLHRRLCEHVAERNKPKLHSHRKSWINSLWKIGKVPVIWPLEKCSTSDWQSREKYWVAFFKPLRLLVNGTDGGDGGNGNKGWKWTKEAREKLSETRKGKPRTQAQLDGQKKFWDSNRKYPIGTRKPHQNKYTPLELTEKRKIWAKLWLKWPSGKTRPKHTAEYKELMRRKMIGRKITWNTQSKLNRTVTAPLLKACNEKRKKSVVAIETGREFSCINDAVKSLGCSYNAFHEALVNGWKCRGLHWKLKEKENQYACAN